MKSILTLSVALMLLVSVLSGCAQTAAPEKEVAAPDEKKEVELVPARKSESNGSKTVVVERDGKFYEMLEEHERLCSDCDR